MAKAIGLEYWEFFDIAYPQRQEPSASGQRLRRLLNQLVPSSAKPAEKPPLQGKELEALLEEMRRNLQALVERVEARRARAPPALRAPAPGARAYASSAASGPRLRIRLPFLGRARASASPRWAGRASASGAAGCGARS